MNISDLNNKFSINISNLKIDFTNHIRNKYKNRPSLTEKPWENRSISSKNDINLACEEAYYLGAVFKRARNGRGKFIGIDVTNILDNLATELHSFFNNKNTNFDFYDLCVKFTTQLNLERNTAGYKEISFGQAQKMINLTIKYLYCYRDSETYKNRFSLCHAPMDSIMKKVVGNALKALNYPELKAYNKEVKYCAWTSLEDQSIYEKYQNAINFIASYASDFLHKKIIPLEIDFYLW